MKFHEVPPCRTAVYRGVEVSDAGIAVLKEKLRIGDVCPLGPFHLLGRRAAFKMAFDVFVIHGEKLGIKDRYLKNFLAEKASEMQ